MGQKERDFVISKVKNYWKSDMTETQFWNYVEKKLIPEARSKGLNAGLVATDYTDFANKMDRAQMDFDKSEKQIEKEVMQGFQNSNPPTSVSSFLKENISDGVLTDSEIGSSSSRGVGSSSTSGT